MQKHYNLCKAAGLIKWGLACYEKQEKALDAAFVCINCGNGTCDAFEDIYSCTEDCSVCGDNLCDEVEASTTECSKDCVYCVDPTEGFCDELGLGRCGMSPCFY
jgi:hypothetical protein